MRLLLILLLSSLAHADPAKLAQAGRHTEAATGFAELATKHQRAGEFHAAIKSHLNAAACLKMSGDLGLATEQLTTAQNLLVQHPHPELNLHLLAAHGSVAALGKKPHLAIAPLTRANSLAKELGQTLIQAEIENDLGIAHAAAANYHQALIHFERADILTHPSTFQLQLHQNQLIAAFQYWQELENSLHQVLEFDGHLGKTFIARHQSATHQFIRFLNRNLKNLNQQKTSSSTLFYTISAGVAAVRFGLEDVGFKTLQAALQASQTFDDPKLERACLLSLADLYLVKSRLTDATYLLEAARQITANPDPIQKATLDLLQAQAQFLTSPQSPKTLATLETAISSIEAIRSDLARTQNISDLGTSFRQKAGQPYLLLANHHLGRPNPSPSDLTKARDAIESFKAWELEDFYRDDCVNLSLKNQRNLAEDISPGTGILYIIPFSTRTEILLGTSRGTLRWTTSATLDQIASLARILRYQLESDYGSISYRKTASKLYQFLIAPGESILRNHNIKHLVFIPDGALGNIPLHVLYNSQSKRFLLEDYSLSIAPGLSMTSGTPNSQPPQSALLAGCSRFPGDITPLPGIETELSQIQKLYQSAPTLLNEKFTVPNLRDALKNNPASVIHIGTHGEFGGTARDTYLRASGTEKISLDLLEQLIRPRKYRGAPIDILCLSACRTAAGDDRAALGFAGTAVKSGCRSVIATLWYVDDDASSEIVSQFHRNLLSGSSKAQALRKAQLDYLRSPKHTTPPHPHFWAPFILIGEWN